MARTPFCYGLLVLLAVSACCHSASSLRLMRVVRPSKPTNLWEVIGNNSDLSVLKALVQAAGMVDLLSNTTSLQTMFMPDDNAFGNYFNATNSSIADLSNSTGLPDLLLYHLHLGSVIKQEDIMPGTVVHMQAAGNISGAYHWYGATVLRDNAGWTSCFLQADIPAGPNAIAHTIDRVFTPAAPATLEEALKADAQFSTFLTALNVGGYNATLKSNTTNMTFLVPTNAAMDAALATMNISLGGLLANRTLLQSIVSTHILPSVQPWATLNNFSNIQYFPTCNSCGTFYTEQDDLGLSLKGVGSCADQTATIIDSDLVAGRFALIQVVDGVLLPLTKWGSKCKFSCQVPADGGKGFVAI